MLFAPNLAWRDEPLKQRVEERLGREVVVENDANASAWAEARFGAARGYRDAMLVALGTGIGAAILIGGELYRGRWGIAGEPGHIRVVPDGRLCGCGNRGCWEQYCSGNALVAEAREFARRTPGAAIRLLQLGDGTPEGISGPVITQAATEGDPAALRCFQTIGSWLGQGLADLAAILDPACFVIGGGVSEAGDLLLDPARAAFERALTGRGHRPLAEIKVAQLGEDAGIVGAADLARASSRARSSDNGAVVAVVRTTRPWVVHTQHEYGEPGDERGHREERGDARYRPARRGGHDQVGRAAEQRRPGALGDRVQLGQRRWRGRDEMLLVVFRRGPRRDLARPDTPGSGAVRGSPPLPRGLDHVRRVRSRPRPRRTPAGLLRHRTRGFPRRRASRGRPRPLADPAYPAPSPPGLPSAGSAGSAGFAGVVRPCAGAGAGRTWIAGPACPRRSVGSVRAVGRLRPGPRHVLALRPGRRPGRGRGRLEPGDQIAPCRVLVALSALRVIPVRHVPTDVRIEACSHDSRRGPVPGG